jgi:hypothetical protein
MQNVGQRDAAHSAFSSWRDAGAIAVVFLAAHLTFLPASLEDLDSINFALGLRQFDVAHHQPHPPGYPVYIAAGRLAHAAIRDEATALGAVSGVAGALGVFALIALFVRIDPRLPRRWTLAAALVTVVSPLYWFTAARPLSDAVGLTAALAIQALAIAASSDAAIVTASVLAGLAIGIRSQVAWLTLPLLLLAGVRYRTARRARFGVLALAAFAAGVAVWAVPLVVLTGGPSAYWHALFDQGAEDLTGIQMLWTTPTPRQLLLALYYAFVAPWGLWQLASGVLAFAAAGLAMMYRTARPSLLLLAVAFGPYLVFDILFQETFTSRYALPLVAPIAYLAVVAASTLPRNAGMMLVLGAAGLCASVAAISVTSYSSMPAPAFRLLGDMRGISAIRRNAAAAPVLAMHRREDLDLRRPIQWVGADMPRFSRRLAAPPKHEWLELVKYWNAGGRDPVWFVADPLRTDVALIDHPSGRHASYRWPLEHPVLLGGVRPNEMVWHIFDSPGWYLGEGWSLTPETAGVAKEDRRGPGVAPIDAWIRRRTEPVTLMVGGRNLSGDGAVARVRVMLDDRTIDETAATPGFFLRFVRLPEGALVGAGAYGRLSIAADLPSLAVEQFDAQSMGRVVMGFSDGWHEMEYNPATGRSWRWMSEHGVMRARAERRALRLSMRGETEGFSRPTRITVRVGDRVVAQSTVNSRFTIQAEIPADLLTGDETAIVVESDQFFVPAERSRRTQDRRHLALRVYEVQLRPAS